MTDPKTTEPSDHFTAEVFAGEREALWDWCRALEPSFTRDQFDARFDVELAEMRDGEAANVKRA
jgi:hypothetical protein